MNSSEWRTCRLGEVASVQTGPFGSQLHQKDYVTVGTPIITVEHLGQNRIIHSDLPRVSEFDHVRLKKYALKEGDIVFSRVGSVDRRAYVGKQEDGWLFSGRCLRVRPDKSVLDAKFLSYYFGLESFKQHIRAIAVGSTMPSLNTSILNGIEVPVPDLQTQYKIASVLSSLDDKIELNRLTNQTLEAIARALFKEWFVEFNFPGAMGEMVETEMGMVPEGWRVGSILDIGRLIGGGTPKTSNAEYWGGEIPWLSGKDISENNRSFIIDTEKKITQLGLDSSSAKLIPKLSTVITARGTVGNYCLLSRPMAISQSNYALCAHNEYTAFFLYLAVQDSVSTMQQMSYGTIFDTITTETLRNLKRVLPVPSIVSSFEEIIEPVFDRILNNIYQNQTLTQLRDSLLPKLMKGEMELNNIL